MVERSEAEIKKARERYKRWRERLYADPKRLEKARERNKLYAREYRKRPRMQEYEKEYRRRPEVKESRAKWQREFRKKRVRTPEQIEKHRLAMQRFRLKWGGPKKPPAN